MQHFWVASKIMAGKGETKLSDINEFNVVLPFFILCKVNDIHRPKMHCCLAQKKAFRLFWHITRNGLY